MELVTQWPLVTTIAIALATIIYSTLKRYTGPSKKNQAPEARGAWPLIGHIPLLHASNLPHKVLAAMAEKHGPIFRIRLGLNEALVISSSEMAKECLMTNDKAALGRPKAVAVELMCYNYAIFGFSPYGAYWRAIRKVVILHLLSNHRLNLLSYVWKSETKIYVERLYELCHANRGSSRVTLVDLKQVFGDLNLSIILRIIAGKRLEASSEEAMRLFHAIEEFFKYLGSFAIGDALPFLRWLDLGGHEKIMKKNFKELDNFLEKWLQEHKEKKSKGLTEENKDFMDVMISVLDQEAIQDCNYDADTIIKSTCEMMIAGGSDTTTVTLTWAFALLLNNPRALQKAKDELHNIVGSQRQVSHSDIPKLGYLQAILKETLRLYPPGPLMGPREFIEDCTIGGYNVEKGTRLIVNLHHIFLNPRVWEDPLEFRPERFLGARKDLDMKGQNFEFFPFGSGRRICPGISFGLQAVPYILASFLHAFEYSTENNALVDMGETFGLTNAKTSPLEVLLSPSLSPESYA